MNSYKLSSLCLDSKPFFRFLYFLQFHHTYWGICFHAVVYVLPAGIYVLHAEVYVVRGFVHLSECEVVALRPLRCPTWEAKPPI